MKYWKVLTSSKMRISRADQGEAERRRVQMATTNPRSRCATLIYYNKAAMVQTPGFGHEDPGLLATPASTYDKAKWRAQQAHVYMIK